MKKLINYLAARLKERSTWLGLIGLLSSVGITLSPANTDAIVTVGVALASAITVLTADKNAG